MSIGVAASLGLVQVVHEQEGMVGKAPGIFQLVIPAELVEDTLNELLPLLGDGDIIIDHGVASNFEILAGEQERLAKMGIQYLDCGTSGGVYGLERGYCLMVGGADTAVSVCAPISAHSHQALPLHPARTLIQAQHLLSTVGYTVVDQAQTLCQNGPQWCVEYGDHAGVCQGFNILHHGDLGSKYVKEGDAEVAPMENPADYQYDIDTVSGEPLASW